MPPNQPPSAVGALDQMVVPALLQVKTESRLKLLIMQQNSAAEARQRAAEAAAAADRRAAAAIERMAVDIANRQREVGELAEPGSAAFYLPRDYAGLPTDILAKIIGLVMADRWSGCVASSPRSRVQAAPSDFSSAACSSNCRQAHFCNTLASGL